MPTIKTIKPAGGGDFTSLAAWEDWADDQATADQWAECYSGGELGGVLLAEWTSAITAEVYPRIYAAAGHEHGGTLSAGAFISSGELVSDVLRLRVEGLRLVTRGIFAGAGEIKELRVDRCVMWGGTRGVSFINLEADSPLLVLRNNLIVSVSGIGLELMNAGASPTVYLDNNTVYGSSHHGTALTWISGGTWFVRNNVSMDNVGDDLPYYYPSGATVAAASNITSDGSAASAGGTGNLPDQLAEDVFLDPGANDLRLGAESIARDAGVAVPEFGPVRDVTGTKRPLGSAFDIGAFEFVPPPRAAVWPQSRRGRFGPMGRLAP